MVVLAVVSIGVLIYDELRHPTGDLRWALIWVDLAIVVVFVVEFGMRLRSAPDKRDFLKRTWYEVPGMVPMIAGELGFLRFFRLFRIVAVSARLFRARRVAQGFLVRSHVLNILGITSLLLFGGAYAEWLFERNVNPGHFANFGEALWWAIVTTTTVGYGDKYPFTLGGRIVASILMLVGIGLIGTLAATFSNALIKPVHQASAQAQGGARPFEERLRDLAEMRAKGQLSETEFELAKRRLLREP